MSRALTKRQPCGTISDLAARTSALALLVVIFACGVDGRPGSERSTPPSAGRVDVGGYELAYECHGSGSPTIVTEAGYDSSGIATWADLIDELAATSRSCAYDRAGTGASDDRPGAGRLTSGDQAAELHALLEGADIEPPYVLVAHSYGGFVSRLFADAYAPETAGLVLIESSHENEIDAYEAFYGDDPEGDWIDGGDVIDIQKTEAELRQARDFGDLPLVAIRAERYEDVLAEDLWRRTQADLATLSTDGVAVVARGSGHFVMEENPGVVVAAIEAVVTAARSDEPLPKCPALFADLRAECPRR